MEDNHRSDRHTVLMTADAIGGVWTWSLDLARALAPYHIDFVIAVMGSPLSPDQCSDAHQCGNVRVAESNLRLEWMPDAWPDVERAGEWLLELAARTRPQVVHLNGYVHAGLPWNAPVAIMAHSCVLSWWEAVKGTSAPAEYDRYASEVRAGLHAADLVAAPSYAMLAALEHHYGALRGARVIANGRDAALYRRGTKEPFVFAAGRVWDEAKNLVALDTVAPELDWPVLVAGDDLHPDGSHRPLANVCAVGRLTPKQLAGWLARAPIYALPALYEPFGLSVLEAALSGCALVLGDIPSLRENWDDAAIFVHPSDTAQLRAALNALIRNEGLHHSLADRARERAATFTAGQMARAWLEVYQELTRRRELLPCA